MEMTFAELQRRCANRFFDRITIVTNRADEIVDNLKHYCGLDQWMIEDFTPEIAEDGDYQLITYTDRIALTKVGNVELCITEPISGNSPCAKYLERFGEGICCLRENMSAVAWERETARYQDMGFQSIAWEKCPDGQTVWFDMMDRFGCLFAVHYDTREAASERESDVNTRCLTQISMTTPDVERTVREMTEVFQIGPWEIGSLNQESMKNQTLSIDGVQVNRSFSLVPAIHFNCNIEIELIQPVEGPTVFRKYLDMHGIGFHHIKEVVPIGELESTVEAYAEKGIGLCVSGTLGPSSFYFLDTRAQIGFSLELGDGILAVPAPEEYNLHTYPAEETERNG